MRFNDSNQGWMVPMVALLAFSHFSNAQGSTSDSAKLPVVETQVVFSSGALQLHGILTSPPHPTGRVPCVLLVEGAEPTAATALNVEQTFSDLANGLAESGIASLRYQQPPFDFAAPPDPALKPLDRQIVNDAVAALRFLSRRPEINASAIFVIGHDLGGTMAPYIAERFPGTRGAVLMAAPAQPIEEALAERKKAELQAEGMPSQRIAEQLAAQNKIFADIRSGKIPSTRLVEGATAAYWRDRMNRDPALQARKFQGPILVLQGGLDNQVSEADYDRLELLLRKKRGATPQFHWFPALDHRFMRVTTPSSKAASNEDGQVDPTVVQTIASWIKSHTT